MDSSARSPVCDIAVLPAWVQSASRPDNRAQPWKGMKGIQDDAPDYDQGKDPLPYINDREKQVCYSEGTMAA